MRADLKRQLRIVYRENTTGPPPQLFKLVMFHKGKRTETKCTHDLKSLAAKATKLKELGVRFRIVSTNRAYAQKGHADEAGKLWCPYCRAWSWFVVPKRGWYGLTTVLACSWCGISDGDYHVQKFNGMMPVSKESAKTTRARKRRVRRAR